MVNEVLSCFVDDDTRTGTRELRSLDENTYEFKGFDEEIWVWKNLKLLNWGLPNHLRNFKMVNVGGRLVIMGRGDIQDEFAASELRAKMGIWCWEIEVKKNGDEDGDFQGEVVCSEMVYSTRAWLIDRAPLFYACMPVCL